MEERNYFCRGEDVNIAVNITDALGDCEVQWSNSSSKDAVINIDSTQNIEVSVRDVNGCSRKRNIDVEFQFPFEEEKILLATYDKETDRNMVIWSRTPGRRTEIFNVFNGSYPGQQNEGY